MLQQSPDSLSLVVEGVIREFNKYRDPEIMARLSIVGRDFVDIDFLGTYCLTCGFHDYFDDFMYMLRDAGLKAELGHVEEFIGGATVEYSLGDRVSEQHD